MSIVYDPISKRLDVICEPVTQKRPSQAKTLKWPKEKSQIDL